MLCGPRRAGEGALPGCGKAQVDVEIPAGVVAAGGRVDEEIVDKGVVVRAAREGMELPHRRPRPAIQRELVLVRRQVINRAEVQVARPHVQPIIARNGVPGRSPCCSSINRWPGFLGPGCRLAGVWNSIVLMYTSPAARMFRWIWLKR